MFGIKKEIRKHSSLLEKVTLQVLYENSTRYLGFDRFEIISNLSNPKNKNLDIGILITFADER